eukprot:c27573_g1_i1 orf=288-1055(+)
MDLECKEEPLSMPVPGSDSSLPVAESARLQIYTSDIGAPAVEVPIAEVKAKEVVRYRECRRNHAVNIGGHTLDGCCEFMPSGEEGTVEALKCAACCCHRNFHRREVEGEHCCYCHRLHLDKRSPAACEPLTPAPFCLSAPRDVIFSHAQMVKALSSTPPDSDDLDTSHGHPPPLKKRFRTKFSTEQKEQMQAFAEKLGWRIRKHDETAVQEFCTNVNVKRNVLKVWIHNNKNVLAKKMENGSDSLKTSDSPSGLS